MKTFKEFQEQLSLSQAFQKAGKGPGVGDWESSRTLGSLRSASTSDRAKPQGSRAGIPAVPLNQSSYRGRVEAGRNTPDRTKKRVADNPDYQGPVRSTGSGTGDRMPGTTPSLRPMLPSGSSGSIPKPQVNTNSPPLKPKKPLGSVFSGPSVGA